MSFDSSRFTFDPWKDFSGVVMPQGRVQLDSDWNEWLAELARRIRAGTLDTLGRAVYPSTTPNAFLITPTAGSISIGVGRMYVDGLLVENHGLPAPNSGGWIPPSVTASATQPAWDPALDELVGTNPIDYTQQPYFPNAATVAPFPTSGGPFLVYLDVWLREITFLEYPDLIEKAVGVDTAGRWQTVWQVKLLDVSSAGTVTCSTPDSSIGPWESLIQPSAGRLTTGVVQSSPSGPCCLAPNTGYTGQENQLYRVEIHQGGTASSKPRGTFKWSRNNASFASTVTGIAPGGTVLTVQSTGKDSVLRFSANDWVEITDDWLELNGLHGELHQISLVTDSANTIQLSTPVSSTSFPVDANNLTNPARHTRLILWDQQGKVYESDGTTVWTDLGAAGSTGDIPIPPPGTALILENGVTVSFDLNPSTGAFNVGDYWNFAARTVDGTVENLVEAPPRGIHHHYARLAILTLPSSASDCRVEWPPSGGGGGGGGGCDCASCVTAASHNSGSWTIQNGIDAVQAQGGGKVCLGPGIYNITNVITISGAKLPAQGIAVCGHGLPTLVPTAAFQGTSIMLIENAIDIDVDGIAFSGGASNPNQLAGSNPAGLLISRTSFVRVERCSFGLVTDTLQLSPAIGFGGNIVMNCAIRGNLFNNVELGIALGATDRYLLTHLEIEDNQMYCTDGGVFLSVRELLVSEIRFAGNFVQSTSGFVLSAQGLDVNIENNVFSIAAATATDNDPYDAAVVCNVSQTRIINNDISINSNGLTAGLSGTQGLPAGAYIWAVTALDSTGRETLITSTATLTLTTAASVQLGWAATGGATSYNVYRTVANGNTLLLDASVAAGSGSVISFTDTAADGTLQGQMPTLQNDGIVLGSPISSSIMYGTQVTGNRINSLIGIGITSLSTAGLIETVIADNEMLALGGNGIVLNGVTVDLDIARNSLIAVAQLAAARNKVVAGIQLQAAMNANLSENKIEQLGPVTLVEISRRAIYIVIGLEVRIAGNLILDIAPTQSVSMGIFARVFNRLDVVDNDVRRSLTAPTQPDQSLWYALLAFGDNISAQGNLFESYGGNLQQPGTVSIEAALSCTFSNNQCFLDNPSGNDSPALVVEVAAAGSIIALGNLVKGPTAQVAGVVLYSMILNVPGSKTAPVTVIGNITSMGISVLPSGMPAAMAPLNITA